MTRAVILAGGRGTRLAPYTTVLPKPLMPIVDMPILEIVLRQLRAGGIGHVTLTVGHLGSLLQAYFGDGRRLGVQLDYVFEDEPLGTAGPLRNVPRLDQTFIVLNGDTLCDIDYEELIHAHRASSARATVAVFERTVPIDFGVVETERGELRAYHEKPKLAYTVSMGIYVLEPEVLSLIDPGHFDFPVLLERVLLANEKVGVYKHSGIWLDIGRPDDLATAQEVFRQKRDQLFK